MIDIIEFDFIKADRLFKTIDRFYKAVHGGCDDFCHEITSAGEWWKGASYVGLSEGFFHSSDGKCFINRGVDRTNVSRNHLSKVIGEKVRIEINGRNYFH